MIFAILLLNATTARAAEPSAWSLRGGVGFLKGNDVPFAVQEVELAWRYPGWSGRFELGLLYGHAFRIGGVPGRDTPATSLLGLASQPSLQLRSRFYLFDPGVSPFGIEPFVSLQAGVLPDFLPGWILPSFGLGLDWYLSEHLALSPALYMDFWANRAANPQFHPELAVKVRF